MCCPQQKKLNMEIIFMPSKKNFILLDSSEATKEEVSEYFKENANFNLLNLFSDVNDAINYIRENKVDLVVTDLVLPNVDGLTFLEKLKDNSDIEIPKVIVASALYDESFIQKALVLGANYYLMKPYDITVLEKRMSEVLNDVKDVKVVNKSPRNKVLEEKITNIFITVGIPAHIKGYQFLREAIKMAIDNPDIINSITKRLYPSIAERFDTSASKVERAIRHAIEVAWNRGKIENINTLFGIRVYSNNEKPTNGEFIALVADKMLIEGA